VRLFAARYRNGDLPGIAGPNTVPVPATMVDTPEHRAMALRAAVESLVLLKNDGTCRCARASVWR
jgi:beta-glucosidase